MALMNPPVVRVTMLIRRPVERVFNAFVDPAVTAKFWFDRASGPLRPGATVTWYWDHYGVSAEIVVRAVEPNRRLEIAWPTPVEWRFTARPDHTTFVEITASGFTGTDDEVVAQAMDSTEGFNLVIAGCKAFLEHGVELNMVADKSPDVGPVGAGNG
jgi:uncharacterized protein YndB with AHSA1/START domain